MNLQSKQDARAILMVLLEKHASMEYVSNYNSLDIGTWTYGNIQSSKSGNYENMIIPIVGKLADIETYEDNITKAFYDDIDHYFTSRRDGFDNQTLTFTMTVEAKINLIK